MYRLTKADKKIVGHIALDGSKSISNRVLMIRAFSGENFSIDHLSTSKDTTTLNHLLSQPEATYDAGAAGTTFRFMTAYLAFQPDTQILSGSARMKQRPIGVLVEALNQLGAKITYLEKEGYPPLSIGSGAFGTVNELTISAGISSQFISALLLLAPILKNGLVLHLEGEMVSRSYIQMTLSIMAHFGINYQWEEQTIRIEKQDYQPEDFRVEADWSAASYYYAMAAFAEELDLRLDGLFEERLQGDAVLAEMMEPFGVETTFTAKGIHLTKGKTSSEPSFQWNFVNCPDIAQTLAVICGGCGVTGHFAGLRTLKIKETDRVMALSQELEKVGVDFQEVAVKQGVSCKVTGTASVDQPTFDTYEDHRMAMAFAPLAMFGAIDIREPMVVVKSYGAFYEDLEKLGFVIDKK